MWKLDNQNWAWVESQQSGIIDKSRVKLAAAVLAVGLSTSVQASDLLDNVLKQCDFNKNWAIDTAEMYGIKSRAEYRDANPKIKDIITREQKCETDFSIAQSRASIVKGKEELVKGKEELAKGKEELARLAEEDKRFNQILAMLDKDELRRALLLEVKKTEEELKREKDKSKRDKLLIRLDILNWKLKELDQKVA